MNIDLNSEEYDASSGGASIFNGGNAGVVNNVTVTVEKKGADDSENAPDYKIIFTDANGANVNRGFWYISGPTQYDSVEKQVGKLAKVMKHVLHVALGPDAKLPVISGANETEAAKNLLDQSMKLLRESLGNMGQVRVYANYGTPEYPKQFIQVRPWVPFMESMTVTEENTRLTASNIEQMTRITEDEPVAETVGADDDDDGAW